MAQEWLSQPVPLWAFLIALLTRPSKWSAWAKSALEKRLGVSASGKQGGSADTDSGENA